MGALLAQIAADADDGAGAVARELNQRGVPSPGGTLSKCANRSACCREGGGVIHTALILIGTYTVIWIFVR